MIPKIIHYCWLSGEPYPELVQKCLDSWKRIMPDYEIRLWDCNRIDIHSNLWLEQAYNNKKYAFAADFIRFYALYHYGGIYLDADVEVFKTFNPLLANHQFIGREAGGYIEAAVIGAEKGTPWIKECLDYYNDRPFIKSNGMFDMRPVPLLVSRILLGKEINIKPFYYFSPKDFNLGKIYINDLIYCIHHFDGKWLKRGRVFKIKILLHRMLYYLLGRTTYNKIIHLVRYMK